MSRQPRKYHSTSFFHVIVQGLNKENIFSGEKSINIYLKLMRKFKEKTKIEILAFCMMSNHAHFLLYSPTVKEMSNMMQKVNTIYAKYYNEINNRVGYVFRDRYLSEPINSERYLVNCINYIHNNPVKANIVKKPGQYKYSTYQSFISGEKIKLLLRLTGVKFDIEQFKQNSRTQIFMDVDKDREAMIESAILEFCIDNQIGLRKILEERAKLRELVRSLKNDYHVKYVEIMRKLNIPKDVMRHLK